MRKDRDRLEIRPVKMFNENVDIYLRPIRVYV